MAFEPLDRTPPPKRRYGRYLALGASAALAVGGTWFVTSALPAMRQSVEHPWVRQCMAQAPGIASASYFIPPFHTPDGRYCLSAPSTDTSMHNAPEGGRAFPQVRDLTRMEVWDSKTRRYFMLEGHTGRIRCFAVATPWMLTASDDPADPAVRLWNLDTVTPVRTFDAGVSACWGGFALMGFSADQRLLVTGTVDQRVRVWDVATGQALGSIAPGIGPTSFAFSPDATRLALGEFTGDVSVWDWRAGKLLRRWHAHDPFGTVLLESGGVEKLAFSADGTRLLTRGPRNGADAAMEWDVATGTPLP